MIKYITITALCVLLTACANSETPAPIPETPPPAENTASSEKTTTVTSETAAISEADKKYFVTGAYGETLDLREAERISYWDGEKEEDVELTPDEAAEKSEYIVSFNGFCYAAKSSGISYNSFDNPEMFSINPDDPFQTALKDDIQYAYEYKRVNVGDKFGGLTVTDALYSLSIANGKVYEHRTSEITFDGEITLTGYIECSVSRAMYMEPGYLFFYPDVITTEDLPVVVNPNAAMSVRLVGTAYDEEKADGWDFTNVLYYCGDSGMFFGSIFDDIYKSMDLSDIPTDGSLTYVSVTMKDLSVRYSEVGLRWTTAVIENIKLL